MSWDWSSPVLHLVVLLFKIQIQTLVGILRASMYAERGRGHSIESLLHFCLVPLLRIRQPINELRWIVVVPVIS